MSKSYRVESSHDIQLAVRSSAKLTIAGNGTKRLPYASIDESDTLELAAYSGIVEYDPSEFTITARAGTRLDVVQAALAEHGQYLPFDPPLVEQGATVGGMIAAGVSGPCRMRFGGVRDFVLGVRYVDGNGALAVGGGKVVKNAAGFDLPRMFVGSWGELGVLVEVTMKVFPKPTSACSLRMIGENRDVALKTAQALTRLPIEIDGLDIDESVSVLVRLSGSSTALSEMAHRLEERLAANRLLIVWGAEEAHLWSPLVDWSWTAEGESLIRVPMMPSLFASLDSQLEALAIRRRYSLAGNLAWIAWPETREIDRLHRILSSLAIPGRILRAGSVERSLIGKTVSHLFADRVRNALDPMNRFATRR